jgi:hypothetical protein
VYLAAQIEHRNHIKAPYIIQCFDIRTRGTGTQTEVHGERRALAYMGIWRCNNRNQNAILTIGALIQPIYGKVFMGAPHHGGQQLDNSSLSTMNATVKQPSFPSYLLKLENMQGYHTTMNFIIQLTDEYEWKRS